MSMQPKNSVTILSRQEIKSTISRNRHLLNVFEFYAMFGAANNVHDKAL